MNLALAEVACCGIGATALPRPISNPSHSQVLCTCQSLLQGTLTEALKTGKGRERYSWTFLWDFIAGPGTVHTSIDSI